MGFTQTLTANCDGTGCTKTAVAQGDPRQCEPPEGWVVVGSFWDETDRICCSEACASTVVTKRTAAEAAYRAAME